MTSPKITYEYERVTDIKRLNFIANSLLNTIPANASILDVGCGNGVITRHLGKFGYNVLGIDVSEKTIAVANSKNTLPNVKFAVISAEQLVASGQQYDAVICSEVLEHLHHPGVLLKTIHQTMKDDGVLVVTVPNGMGPREVFVTKPMLKVRRSPGLQSLVNRVKNTLGYSGTTVQSQADNLDHVQFFTRRDLQQLAAENNFEIVQFAKTNFVEDVFPFSLVTKRVKPLQAFDCQVAELLPLACTGGFNTIWKKIR